jgi:hypothetical protein
MNRPTDTRRAYTDALISRLRRLYVEQQVPPGQHKPMTFETLRQLCRYVLAEGYGKDAD